MWYVLAAANALAGDSELIAGTQLRVPEVGVSKNDASSFKPYNPNEIVGSTSPGLPYIPPASSLSCKQTLILIATTIVRVVAAYFLSPVGVMMVDALMQKVEINSGIRSEYSLGQTVAAGVFALFAQPISNATGWAKVGYAALAAATAYTSSYLVDKSRGANVHFNWGNLAASVVTSMISTKLGAVGNTGVAAGGTVSAAVRGTAFSWAKVATDTMKNLAISVVNQGVTQLITGDKAHWDAGALFADSFGNALGSAVAQALDQKFLSAAERKQLNAMPENMKREYDALRAQGKSQQQAYDFVTNAGGLRAMGDQLIASFGAREYEYSEPGAARSQRVISKSGAELSPAQIEMMNDEYHFRILPKLEKLMETYDRSPDRGSNTLNDFAFRFAEIAAPFTHKYGYEIGANIIFRDNVLKLTDISLGYYNKKTAKAGVAIPTSSSDIGFILADVHTHTANSIDGFSGYLTTILGGGAVGDHDFYSSYSKGADGYVFRIDNNSELRGFRFDYESFKHDQQYFKDIQPIDARNKSPFTNEYYWTRLKKP